MYHAKIEIPSPSSRDKEHRIPMSYEDYTEWDAPEGGLVEWVNGEAIFHMAPRFIHQSLTRFLTTLFHMFISAFKLGIVVPAPTEMHHLPGYASREPDVLCEWNHTIKALNKALKVSPGVFWLKVWR